MQKRPLFYEISKYLEHKNALIISGLRQVGKTTLARQLFDSLENKPKLWFDLDNPLDQKLFEDLDYHNIYKNLQLQAKTTANQRLFIFIDEIQNLPEITKVIKFLIDHYQVKFVVTGSSNFYLKNLFPESLSGRKFLYVLHPLNFLEYLYFKNKISLKEASNKDIQQVLQNTPNIFSHKKLKTDYNDYLQFGGFPEVTTTSDIETKKQVLKNIFASFFEKDLKILSDYKDIRELRDLILLLVPRVGSLLDVSKLASELWVNRPKIYHYLEFLQGTFFIKLLPKYSKSIDKSVASGKKIYFADTGILNTIGQVNDAQLFENTIINQLSHYGDLSFYNRRNTAEIDAILDKKIALEIKLTGSQYDLNKLAKLSRDLGLPEHFVVSKKYVDGIERVISPVGL